MRINLEEKVGEESPLGQDYAEADKQQSLFKEVACCVSLRQEMDLKLVQLQFWEVFLQSNRASVSRFFFYTFEERVKNLLKHKQI